MRMFVILLLLVIVSAAGFNFYTLQYSIGDVSQILKEISRCETAQEAMHDEAESFRLFVRVPSENNLSNLNQAVSHCRSSILLLPYDYEEIGAERYARTWRARNAYKSYAERTRYAFVYEGSSATGVSCAERKGGIVYTVRFKGVAGHCGYVFTNGAKSAVHEMGRWIVALADMQDEAIGTSVNVGIANGGITKNTVAPDAMMVVDIRIKDNSEPARFEAAIARLTEAAEKRGIGVEIERRFKPALVYTDEVRAYVEHVCEITKAAGIPFSHAPRGGLSDANIIASYGAICLDGLGPSSGGGSHSPDEKSQYKTAEHFKNLSLFLMKDIAENK
jgi:acetylornithine deacetylase/succinyl-diaminopimelate desuccinylase-like protein